MKKNKPMVSIIIPVYKGELYIVKCLDSITKQNYPCIEIVIVDDESPDNSVELIRTYAEKVNTSIKIISQKNKGQGAARNLGIDNASGEYLMFVDQDDTIEPEIVSRLLVHAIKSKSDIVSCGYKRITADGRTKHSVHLKCTEWSKFKVIAPWAKLYKTEFIQKNQIRFLPVVFGEDIYFLMKAYSYKPKVSFLSYTGYNWLYNVASVSNTIHKQISDKTSLLQLFDKLQEIEEIENLNKDRMYEYFLIKTAIYDILYTAGQNSYTTVLDNSIHIWNWFDMHFNGYMNNPYISIFRPKGESPPIRLIVWGYMLLKKAGFEKLFLRILSKI